MNENIQYENRLIAFVDLLGFKDIVNQSCGDSIKSYQAKKNIYNILKAIYELKLANDFDLTDRNKIELDKMGSYILEDKFPQISLTFFSDCIVISMPIAKKDKYELNYVKFLEKIIQISLQCISYGFLLRGGITCGQLIHNKIVDNICYGPAMNRAYLMESQKAIYPRILVDAFAIKEFLRDTDHADVIRNYLKADIIDGEMLIDYLSQKAYYESDKYLDKIINDYLGFLRNIRSLIMKSQKKFKNNSNIYSKYEWYKTYYNDTIKQVIHPSKHDEFLIK